MHVGGVNRSDLQILLPSRLWICERGRLYRANQGLVPLQVLREGELHKNQWNVPRQSGMRFQNIIQIMAKNKRRRWVDHLGSAPHLDRLRLEAKVLCINI
jgi:hypothetical protein